MRWNLKHSLNLVSLAKLEKVKFSGSMSFVWVLDTKADYLPANAQFYNVQILSFKQNQT